MTLVATSTYLQVDVNRGYSQNTLEALYSPYPSLLTLFRRPLKWESIRFIRLNMTKSYNRIMKLLHPGVEIYDLDSMYL